MMKIMSRSKVALFAVLVAVMVEKVVQRIIKVFLLLCKLY